MNRSQWVIVIVVTILFGAFSILRGGYTRESDIMLQVGGAFVFNYLIASSLTQKKKSIEERVDE